MISINQIKEAHAQVRSGADFPAYIRELKKLGVFKYETAVTDGHSTYYINNQDNLSSEAIYAAQKIETTANIELFLRFLKQHQQGETDYMTFCEHAAQTGIVKWQVDLTKMTCTYLDQQNNELLTEPVPQ